MFVVHIDIETGALVCKREWYGVDTFRNCDLTLKFYSRKVASVPYSTLLAVIELGCLVFPEI